MTTKRMLGFCASDWAVATLSSPLQPARSSIETINKTRLPRLPSRKAFIIILLGLKSELYAPSEAVLHHLSPGAREAHAPCMPAVWTTIRRAPPSTPARTPSKTSPARYLQCCNSRPRERPTWHRHVLPPP